MSFLQFNAPPLPHYVAIGEDTYEPGDKHPNRRNINVFDLLVVTRGQLFIGEDQDEWEIEPGHALVLRPDRHHFSGESCLEQTHFYWLHFQTTGEWSEVSEHPYLTDARVPNRLYRTDDPTGSSFPYEAEETVTPYGKLSSFLMKTFPIRIARLSSLAHPSRAIENLSSIMDLERHPQPSARWQQQLLFQEVVQDLQSGQTLKDTTPAVQLAEQAASFLREHYRSEITYAVLQDHLNFHPTYVARCMRSVFNCAPLEYLIRYRIEQAKMLLMNSDMAIKNVADEVGFRHFSYFCRAFVKIEGVSPRVFRARYRT